jgi:hypothetical protein
MKRIVWLTISILSVLIIIFQFIPVRKLKSELYPASDFFAINTTTSEVKNLIRNACYDCHSNETVLPWYSKIAPVSWILNDHIIESRDNLNFSNWGLYSSNDIKDILKSCIEELNKGDMPLLSYKLMHPDSRLSDKDKALIINLFTNVRSSLFDEKENEDKMINEKTDKDN